MKKKIAFISGWYNFGGNNGISDDYRFMTNCLYDSAKKYLIDNGYQWIHKCCSDDIFIKKYE